MKNLKYIIFIIFNTCSIWHFDKNELEKMKNDDPEYIHNPEHLKWDTFTESFNSDVAYDKFYQIADQLTQWYNSFKSDSNYFHNPEFYRLDNSLRISGLWGRDGSLGNFEDAIHLRKWNNAFAKRNNNLKGWSELFFNNSKYNQLRN